VIERSIAVRTHGRYLVSEPSGDGPWPLLVGFHGYAEDAAVALERVDGLDPARRWLRVAVQGLHRFYRGRTNEVIANWMTRQDRVQAIADNLAYVAAAVDAVAGEWAIAGPLVFSGFSQGVAMAFRAAAASTRPVAAVVALGGDVPPEIGRASLQRIPRVLLGHGTRDHWYTQEKFAADAARLHDAGVSLETCEFDGPHEWAPPFVEHGRRLLDLVIG
jgi:predicted esterase